MHQLLENWKFLLLHYHWITYIYNACLFDPMAVICPNVFFLNGAKLFAINVLTVSDTLRGTHFELLSLIWNKLNQHIFEYLFSYSYQYRWQYLACVFVLFFFYVCMVSCLRRRIASPMTTIAWCYNARLSAVTIVP